MDGQRDTWLIGYRTLAGAAVAAVAAVAWICNEVRREARPQASVEWTIFVLVSHIIYASFVAFADYFCK